jgi:hypothetical protein
MGRSQLLLGRLTGRGSPRERAKKILNTKATEDHRVGRGFLLWSERLLECDAFICGCQAGLTVQEIRGGESSIFGAVREKKGHGFSRIVTDTATERKRQQGVCSVQVRGVGMSQKNFRAGPVSGLCTESAQEMQKAFSSEECFTLYWERIGNGVAQALGPDLV